jgi:hypothetical protein
VDKKVRESNGKLTASEVCKTIQCPGCNRKGHIRPDCKSSDEKDSDKDKSRQTKKAKKSKGPANGSMFQSVAEDDAESSLPDDPYGAFSSVATPNVTAERDLISLDSHANISVFNNKKYLTDLRKPRRLSVSKALTGPPPSTDRLVLTP